jgi:hypothetical protein
MRRFHESLKTIVLKSILGSAKHSCLFRSLRFRLVCVEFYLSLFVCNKVYKGMQILRDQYNYAK